MPLLQARKVCDETRQETCQKGKGFRPSRTGDGNARRADIVRPAQRLELDQGWDSFLVAVPDMHGEVDFRPTVASADGARKQPQQVPEPARLILADHTRRNGYAPFPDGPRQSHGVTNRGVSDRRRLRRLTCARRSRGPEQARFASRYARRWAGDRTCPSMPNRLTAFEPLRQ
jgi:hypothetical protein